MFCIALLLTVWMCAVSADTTKEGQLRGLQYIGVGYDIVKGNPEGDEGMAGTDPGLLFTRKILKIDEYTEDDIKLHDQDDDIQQSADYSGDQSEDGTLFMDGGPKQIAFEPRKSCQNKVHQALIKDSKSYQGSLSNDVSTSAGFDALKLIKFKFTASANFKFTAELTDKKHSVIMEEKEICNLGRVRYKTSLAMANSWPVTDEFAASVCQLPNEYNQKAYMKFLDDFGTHAVVRADIGSKKVSKFINTLEEFITSANMEAHGAVNVEGSDLAGTANAVVDVKTLFKLSRNTNTFKNTTDKISRAVGEEIPEPISIKVESIDTFLKPDFWQTLERFVSSRICKVGEGEDDVRDRKMKLLQKAMEDYPAYVGGKLPQDLVLKMPIVWPKGRYGLPMTRSGCPEPDKGPKGYKWNRGWRFQDSADVHAFFRKPKWPEHIKIDYDSKNNVNASFCTKTQLNWISADPDGDVYERPWSRGRYCLYKKGPECPQGFAESSIYWKDQRGYVSKGNNQYGSLPQGEYCKKKTRIFFCCRADGYTENEIFLPTGLPQFHKNRDTKSRKPFSFFSLDKNHCQKVNGMRAKPEMASWDAHTGTTTKGDLLPYGEYFRTRVNLQYCYYDKPN